MSDPLAIMSAHEAADHFRILLDAMARPGHAFAFAPKPGTPKPLSGGLATIARTLCDFQSPIWVAPALRTDAVKSHLKFQTGAPITNDAASAQFAFMNAIDGLLPLSAFSQGTHEYPDRSTTLVIQVEEFAGGEVELSGPGLKSPITFGSKSLPRSFWIEMIGNHSQFPLGVDVILVSRFEVACIPRSTSITLQEHD